MAALHVLSFGELLWDIIDGTPYIGGAPFNLSAHMAALGADVHFASSLGRDDLGEKARKELKQKAITDDLIQISEKHPTGRVHVRLDEAGVPRYRIEEDVAWDHINLSPEQIAGIEEQRWDLFVFGTLAQREMANRTMVKTLLDAASPREVFFDVNLRLHYYDAELLANSLARTSILKLNDEEIDAVSRAVWAETLTEKAFVDRIRNTYPVHSVCVTKGKEGASLYSADGSLHHEPVVDVPVRDTVGAGDSFSAAFLSAFLKGQGPVESLRFAVRLSSFVASQNGAVPAYTAWIEKEAGAIRDL